MNDAQLWQALATRGLVEGDTPGGSDHPWPIRLMVGAGAWAGSLFVLAFLAALTFDLLEHSVTRLLIAAMSLGAARYLATRGELITEQLALVAAALAQTLIVWSIFADLSGQATWASAVIGLGLICLLVPLALFRIWCGLLCLGGLVALLDGLALPAAAALVCVACAGLASGWWLHPQLGPGYALLRSLAMAAALFALGAALILSRASRDLWLGDDAAFSGAALASTGLIAINLFLVFTLGKAARRQPLPAMLLILMLGLACWTTPGVSAALLLLLLGYGRGERWLLALGLIGLPLALFGHYYVLSWSLNLKALSLQASGVLLLSARLWLRRRQPEAST